MTQPEKKVTKFLAEMGDAIFVKPPFRVLQAQKEAKALLQDSATTRDEAVELYNLLGQCAASRGDFQEAHQQHQRALKLAPRNALSLNNVGFSCFELGDIDGAMTHWLEAVDAVEAWPPNLDTNQLRLRTVIFSNLAEGFARVGSPNDAADALAEAVSRLDPTCVGSHMLVARQAAVIGEDGLALEYAARALALVRRVPRGTGPAIDMIEASSAERAQLHSNASFDALLARVRAMPELAALPALPRGKIPDEDDESGVRVHEEFSALRKRANAAAMADE